MFESFLGNSFLVVAALTFVAVLLMLEGGYLFWQSHRGPQARKLRDRLRGANAFGTEATNSALLKARFLSDLSPMERNFRELPQVREMSRYIEQAGMRWTVPSLLLGSVVLGVVGLYVAYELLRQSLLTSLIAAVVLTLLPLAYVRMKRQRRLNRIEAQLPDALDLMTRALRAGHAFTAGLKMVSEEIADPIGGEFRILHDEVSYGITMQQALVNLTERVPLTDLRYFMVAVLIQRESGGNLTEVLSNLARLVRERAKLAAKVRVMSTDGRMSALILGCLPFAIGGVLYLVNPKFMGPLFTDPIGTQIVSTLLIMMAMGAVVLRQIIRIRF